MSANNRPLTTAELATIRERNAAGHTLTAIARDMGRAKSTVAKAAKGMGLSWDTTRTATATEAVVVTNRARRADLETRLLTEAGLLLDQLHRPHLVYSFGGRDNTYAEHLLDEPDIGGKRSLVQAAGTAIDKAVRLADVDRDTTGARAGQSLVGGLFALLKATDPGETPDETPDD